MLYSSTLLSKEVTALLEYIIIIIIVIIIVYNCKPHVNEYNTIFK